MLIIGLGGSGGKTIRAIKEVLHQNLESSGYGAAFPQAWQFLHIDTMYTQSGEGFPAPLLAPQEFCSVVPPGSHRDVLLSAIEKNSSPRELQEFLAGWGIPSLATEINQSRSMKRADARQAGIPNLASTVKVIEHSAARMQQPNSLVELEDLSSALSLGPAQVIPQVFIFTSIGGFAGSGLLADIAELLKSLTTASWSREAVSFIYTPDVFKSIGFGERELIANALGAMNELIASGFVGLSEKSQELYSKFGIKPRDCESEYGCHNYIPVGARNISNDLEDETLDEIIRKFGGLFGKAILKGEIPNFLENQIAIVRNQSSMSSDISGLFAKKIERERFGRLGNWNLPPIWTFAPLAESMLKQAAISKSNTQMWHQFWYGRRTRPLTEAIPFETEIRRSMITGWFVARLFGLIEIDFDKNLKQDGDLTSRPISDEVAVFLRSQGLALADGDRQKNDAVQSNPSQFIAGRTVRIWNPTLQVPGWSSFPCPLLPTHDRDEEKRLVIPQLLVSAGIALVEFGKFGNQDSIAGYRLLKYIGREVTTSVGNHDSWDGNGAGDLLPTGLRGKSTLLQDWVKSQIRPIEGPEPMIEFQGNLEDKESRKQVTLNVINEIRKSYQRLWKELEEVSWQNLPESWELKEDIDLALTSIYEFSEQL